MDALARLDAAAAKLPHSSRAMFGGRALLTEDGRMFAGVWAGSIAIKLVAGSPHHADLVARGGEPWSYVASTGRLKPMVGWLVVPREVVEGRGTLARWLARAHEAASARSIHRG